MKTIMNGADLSRRTILAGSALVTVGLTTSDAFGAAVATIEAEGCAALQVHPDAELLRQCLELMDGYREFDRLYDEEVMLESRLPPESVDEPEDPAFLAAVERADEQGYRCDELRQSINATPAQTLEGIAAKAILAAYHDFVEQSDTNGNCGMSVTRDLYRLAMARASNQTFRQILAHPITAEVLAWGMEDAA